METKGSITVFFTLLLSLMISLISGMLLSAKIAVGRTQIALAVDQAMYSTMAKYDSQLFKEYHLLYIDGGYGTGTLQLGKALDEIETDLSYILIPNKERKDTGGKNLLQLDKLDGAITGYTLSTDYNGSVFKDQIVSYMKDTFGIQGISLLAQELSQKKECLESQTDMMDSIEQKGTIEDYEKIKKEAKEQEENIENMEFVNEGSGDTEFKEPEKDLSEETRQLAKEAEVMLDTAAANKGSGLLEQVLPDERAVSGWTTDHNKLLSQRNLQKGMGCIKLEEEETMFSDLLFQEYIVQNINHYQKSKRKEGPAYGIEWMIFEKRSDMENLEAMAKRLLLIREAANVAGICADQEKMTQVRVLADSLALVLKMPFVSTILEGAILLSWAYAESLVDVCCLFDEKSVPMVKNSENWQVSLGDIPGALQSPKNYCKNTTGISYETYLRLFLYMKSEEETVMRCMEVIEQGMRELEGKEQFSFDCAIDSIETSFHIRSEDFITFEITRNRSYRSLEGGV